MVVKIILCIIVGTLFMIMLSLYREVHRKNNYPAAVFVEGEIISTDGRNKQSVHLKIRLKEEETGGIIDE